MPTFLAEQFVRLRPDLTGFRGTVEREAAAAVAGQEIIIPGQLQLSGLEGLGTAATNVENLSASLGGIAAEGQAADAAVGGFGDTLGTAATTASALAQGTARASAAENALAASTVRETAAVEAATAAETSLIRVRARRAVSVGLFRFAGVGVAAGAALFAATQAVGQLSDALAVSGNEAATAGGRFRNFASNVLRGNFVGAISAAADSTHEFSLAELEAVGRSPALEKALNDIGRGADLLKSRIAALEGLTQISATIALPLVKAEVSGDQDAQIQALERLDAEVQTMIDRASHLNLSEEQLSAVLTSLIGQQGGFRSKIKAIIDEQTRAVKERKRAITRLAGELDLPNTLLARIRQAVGTQGADAGRKIGEDFIEGVSAGIISEQQQAVSAARQAVADVIRAGDERIRESIRDARSNLESLGDELSQQLAEVIDVGPLGQKLDELRKRLDDLQDDVSKRKLRFDLGDAQRDLEEAQSAVAAFGKLTPEQKKEQEVFLQPFREKVGDAKAALKEFDLDAAIDAQEKLKDQAVETAEQGIQKLVGRFEDGKISAGQFAALLRQQLAPAIASLPGANLGFSFTRDFLREVSTLVQQAKDLSGFLGASGTTPGPQSVKPAQTVAQVQRDIRDANIELARQTKESNRLIGIENARVLKLTGSLDELIRLLKPRPKPVKSGTTGIPSGSGGGGGGGFGGGNPTGP